MAFNQIISFGDFSSQFEAITTQNVPQSASYSATPGYTSAMCMFTYTAKTTGWFRFDILSGNGFCFMSSQNYSSALSGTTGNPNSSYVKGSYSAAGASPTTRDDCVAESYYYITSGETVYCYFRHLTESDTSTYSWRLWQCPDTFTYYCHYLLFQPMGKGTNDDGEETDLAYISELRPTYTFTQKVRNDCHTDYIWFSNKTVAPDFPPWNRFGMADLREDATGICPYWKPNALGDEKFVEAASFQTGYNLYFYYYPPTVPMVIEKDGETVFAKDIIPKFCEMAEVDGEETKAWTGYYVPSVWNGTEWVMYSGVSPYQLIGINYDGKDV